MSLTRNEERLLQWSAKNQADLRGEPQGSYWKEKQLQGDGVSDYNAETLKEMQAYLEAAGIEPDLALIFSAEAMKQKTNYFREEEAGQQETGAVRQGGDIPDYVYMF